jgi:multicomponent Na+:H+ antiporter subunit D
MNIDFNIQDDGLLIKLALLMPLLAGLLSFLVKRPNLRDCLSIILAIVTFLIVIDMYYLKIEVKDFLEYKFSNFLPNLPILFKVDFLGVLFAIVASFLWIITTLYAVGYMRGNKEENQNRFFGFFAISIFGALGLAFAGNLVTLFIFYEILTLSTYPLVTHSGTEEAKKSGRKYLGILLGTSICLQLPAIIITYLFSGNLEFADTAILDSTIKPIYIGLLLLMFVWGVGKAAVMPFHKWLPAAMVAPTPVSALLHAVAVVKAGLFTILKVVVYVFGIENLQRISLSDASIFVNWMPWLAAFTVITASIIALKQDNLKLRLAYSTISQLSYVVMAAGMFNYKAIIGGSFHIAAHAAAKITLFFAAGAIYTASKKKYISELGGIGKRMPITCTCFVIGSLSMIGLPPTAGLISKFYLMQGAHERSEYFVIELIISTVLNAMYFLPIIFAMFFEKETVKAQKGFTNHGEAPKQILIAISITAFLTVAIFIYPDPFINLATLFVNSVKY